MTEPNALERVLIALADDPEAHHWAFDLAKVTELGPDTLYPLLARLEVNGYVESGWADPESPYPRRRGYRLTVAGQALLPPGGLP
jgi:DNA-binding PadR family transcriptional regulator